MGEFSWILHYNQVLKERCMMKRTAIFIAIVMIILLGACATVNNEVEAELRATLVAVNVEQTVQAEKKYPAQ